MTGIFNLKSIRKAIIGKSLFYTRLKASGIKSSTVQVYTIYNKYIQFSLRSLSI